MLQLVDRTKLYGDGRVAANLLGRHVKHLAYVFGLDIHLRRVFRLVDDHTPRVTFVYIPFEVAVRSFLRGARSFGNGVAATGEKKDGQHNSNGDVEPVHIETWHLGLPVVIVVGIVLSVVHC